MAWRFPVLYFLVSFWVSRCVFPLSGHFCVLLGLLSFSLFVMFFVCHILVKIVRFILHPVVRRFLCHLLPRVETVFFRCFGMSCFVCIVLLFISLIFFLSPVPYGLFAQVLLLFFLVLPFPFWLSMFQRLSSVLSFWPVFVDVLSTFPVEFPILVLIFFFFVRFFRWLQFSRKLISLQHKLVHLIRLYYSLIYMSVLDSLYSSAFLHFSILCFLTMVR